MKIENFSINTNGIFILGVIKNVLDNIVHFHRMQHNEELCFQHLQVTKNQTLLRTSSLLSLGGSLFPLFVSLILVQSVL